jgi:hypothetical protein
MSETEGTDLNAMEREPPIWTPPISQISSGWQQAASLILCAALIVAGVYILSNYLRALVWALVLAVALWPAYDRLRRKTRRSFAKKLLPILVTALVGSTVFLPLTVLAIEVVREVHEIVDYGRSVEDSGIPVPVFVSRLPYGGPWLADWWNGHLAHAGWAKDFIQQINTSSTRELGRSIGLNAIHRAVLFGVCLLTLFFLFLDGEAVSSQVSHRFAEAVWRERRARCLADGRVRPWNRQRTRFRCNWRRRIARCRLFFYEIAASYPFWHVHGSRSHDSLCRGDRGRPRYAGVARKWRIRSCYHRHPCRPYGHFCRRSFCAAEIDRRRHKAPVSMGLARHSWRR